MRGALRAVIFDVDGTLAETEETHRVAFNAAFAGAGLAWAWSRVDYRALLTTTGGRERIARYRREMGLAPDTDGDRALHLAKNGHYARMVAEGALVARPGVLALLAECRAAGVACAIATTTSRANLDALLTQAFAPEWFSVMVVGEDVRAKKPDPEVYWRALELLGCEAGACVAIEDSVAGLMAARSCGIATVVTPSVYTAGGDFSGAALVFETLEGVSLERLAGLI